VNVAANPSGVIEPLPGASEPAKPAAAAPAADDDDALELARALDAVTPAEDTKGAETGEAKRNADGEAGAGSPSSKILEHAKEKAKQSKTKDEDDKDKQQSAAGSGKKKGANTGGKGFSPTETADLPVFESLDTLTEMDLDEANKSKDQKVYDLSDVDTEEADEGSFEKL
jgi:hypothetical protein